MIPLAAVVEILCSIPPRLAKKSSPCTLRIPSSTFFHVPFHLIHLDFLFLTKSYVSPILPYYNYITNIAIQLYYKFNLLKINLQSIENSLINSERFLNIHYHFYLILCMWNYYFHSVYIYMYFIGTELLIYVYLHWAVAEEGVKIK